MNTTQITLLGKSGRLISVGEYHPDHADEQNSTGFLSAKHVNLNEGVLFLDPDYSKKTAVAEIGSFTDQSNIAGADSIVNGNVVVGQNAALLVGIKENGEINLDSARSYLKSIQNANGSLSNEKDQLGSVLYVNSQQTVNDGKKIIIDSNANAKTAFTTDTTLADKYTDKKAFSGASSSQAADLYLGKNSALVLGDGANVSGGAIKFLSSDAAVYAEEGAKIVLDGSSFLNGSREVTVFTDADTTNPGVKVLGTADNNIRVETVNGLMSFYLVAGKEDSKGTLKLDTDKVDSAFTAASAPMRDFLLGYTTLTKNWEEIKYTDKKAFSGASSSQAADLYLGKNSALVLGDGANVSGGAIKFLSSDAAVYAEEGAKIVLDGSSFLNGSREVTVFTDADTTNPGVKVLGTADNNIRVETVNGLMSFYLVAGKEDSKGTLKLDTDKVDSAFTAASAPMRDFLLGYTTLTKNWEEMYPRDGAPVAPGVKEEVLLGVAGPAQKNFVIDPNGKITGFPWCKRRGLIRCCRPCTKEFCN